MATYATRPQTTLTDLCFLNGSNSVSLRTIHSRRASGAIAIKAWRIYLFCIFPLQD